jgi:hypothetical protein
MEIRRRTHLIEASHHRVVIVSGSAVSAVLGGLVVVVAADEVHLTLEKRVFSMVVCFQFL